jgi:peptidyl-prolyl cis-trans isomerase C
MKIQRIVDPRLVLAVGLGLSLCGAAAGRAADAASGPRPVARVNGRPVYAAEVRVHLQPAAPRVGAGPMEDPRRRALDQAIGLRLLAEEAERRGLPATGEEAALREARRVQALLRDEVGSSRFQAAAISDQEARAFYERHQARLAPLASLELFAVVVADAARAESLLAEAAAADDERFAQLVREHSLDEASKVRQGELAVVDEHAHGLDEPLARVAVRLRSRGSVGLAQGTDGRYWVLRAGEVRLVAEPWTPALALRVKNLMAHERRQAAIDALIERLRRQARIDVDRAVLDRV